MRTTMKRGMSLLLCFMIVLAYTIGLCDPLVADAASVDVGSNPTPVVDIAVSVPSDYPGTFLDFKEELTQKLLEQGMSPGSFRITNTQVSIDTTNLDGWYVYDHYYDQSAYNALKLSSTQQTKQPFRQADNSYVTGGLTTMEAVLKNGNVSNCRSFNQHIWSYADDDGKASMVFAGYGKQALMDYMIYPATSDARRTLSFDIDANAINAHTLAGYGFLLNAGIENGKLVGYALYFNTSHSGSIYKVNLDAASAGAISGTVVPNSSMSMGLTSTKKARLTVELNKTSVTVQVQQYDAQGNLSAIETKLKNIPLDDTGFNGFGPVIGYASHSCSGLTVFRFLDLEMSYETSAFDALKNVQYYQGADYKYFINLAGSNNDPGIPDEKDQSYADGINRMNENELFYISNADDGKVLTDNTKDASGKLTHQGLGSENGFIASGDNYIEQMAQYIYTNLQDGVKFKAQPVDSELPLANFYMKNTADDTQLMTIHLQHLVNTNGTVNVNIVDKSKVGTLAGTGADAKIAKWNYKVYDPNNNVVKQSGWVDSVDKIPDYTFTKNSASGRWTFELVVKDQKGNESKVSQTYLIAFLDNEMPNIKGENSSKNKAKITLTDTGMGIDEDGITFREDGRGSGVAAYWVTDDTGATPSEDDWVQLPAVQHSYSFEQEIVSTDPLVVWVKDECGNVGKKAIFEPIHVIVEDEDGIPIDDYYVIGDKPIIVLPEDDVVPPSKDDGDEFSGWVVPGGEPVTPGTTPDPDDTNTVIIRPEYSHDTADLVYLANGGKIQTSSGAEVDDSSYKVVSGASILAKIEAQNVTPTREGYTFKGWKLLKTQSSTASSYINNSSNVEAVTTQTADKTESRDTYYLVAQWEIGQYKVKLDANGGSLGNVKSIENIAYGTNVGTLALPTSGRGVPTKAGFIFQGWSATNDNNVNKIFKYADGVSGSAVTAPTMPAGDMTVYAVWKADTNKFVVSFDSDGGSKISDQAYLTASATKYDSFLKPSKAGYSFDGWYLKGTDGKATGSEYKGGENLIQKSDHTFIAKWIPKTDTKYAVDYFIANGYSQSEYSYTKANEAAKSYTGTTEQTVEINEKDKLPEITVNGRDYWYDEGNENEILSGTITGNPTLSLRLYYKGYYNVEVTSNDETGEMGTVTSAMKQKEDTTPTVSWQAKPGYHVAKVIVDGKVRDDLVDEGQYTLEYGIHKDHQVQVVFEEGAGSQPQNVYQISTALFGCTDGSCEISPSVNVEQGGDVTLEWKVGAKYKVDKVLLDGEEFDKDAAAVVLQGIQYDHKLMVYVVKADGLPELPTIGGGKTEGYCTVTVNRYGGGSQSSVSESTTKLKRGENYPLSWIVGEGDELYKINVDGKDKTPSGKGSGSMNVQVSGNVVIDVYFADKGSDTEVPDFRGNEDEYVKVTTQVVGGPGTITGGAVLKKESDYEVAWDAGSDKTKDPDSADYSYYEVISVEVDGKEVTADEHGSVNLENLTEDSEVVVKVAPVLHDIGLYAFGNGTISYSKTVFHQQNYRGISATPDAGSSIARIIVDGETIFDTELKAEETTEDDQNKDDEANIMTASGGAVMSMMAEADEPEALEDPEAAEPETPQAEYVAKVDTAALARIQSTKTDLSIQENNVATTNFGMAVLAASEDHVVQVFFTEDPENGSEGSVTPAPSADEICLVSAKVQGYEGGNHFFRGTGFYSINDNAAVSWSIPSGYNLTGVTLNGEPVAATNLLQMNNLTGNQEIVVMLEKKDTYKDPIESDYKEKEYTVTTNLVGGLGTITPSTTVKAGENKQISWSITPVEGKEIVVKSVTVNGEVRNDLKGLTEFTLLCDQDYDIVVKIGKKSTYIPMDDPEEDEKEPGEDKKPEVNKDTDGDGEPDINIDTDGDDEPDINIDTDGDDEPDINIDTDGDGEPDVNIDTDGDGEPDVNIDTDGDGIADSNLKDDADDDDDNSDDPTENPVKNPISGNTGSDNDRTNGNGGANGDKAGSDNAKNPRGRKAGDEYKYPRTSDDNEMGGYLFMLLCAAGSLAALLKRKKEELFK